MENQNPTTNTVPPQHEPARLIPVENHDLLFAVAQMLGWQMDYSRMPNTTFIPALVRFRLDDRLLQCYYPDLYVWTATTSDGLVEINDYTSLESALRGEMRYANYDEFCDD